MRDISVAYAMQKRKTNRAQQADAANHICGCNAEARRQTQTWKDCHRETVTEGRGQ